MSINNATPDEWDSVRAMINARVPCGDELTLHRTLQSELSDEVLTSTFAPLETLQAVNPKAAIGAAKAPFFGIPWTAIIEMGAVMDGGAFKYGAYNYRDTNISTTTYHDAILRHFMLWADGEDTDPESKASHLAHVMACCALMIDAQENGKLVDDRSKTGSVRPMLDRSAKMAREFREG